MHSLQIEKFVHFLQPILHGVHHQSKKYPSKQLVQANFSMVVQVLQPSKQTKHSPFFIKWWSMQLEHSFFPIPVHVKQPSKQGLHSP